jgi:nicotinate-nucleotide adenylyltransferase
VAADATETVAIFGGSFDPPHTSHVMLAAYVLATAPVGRMLVVPTWQHALDKAAAAAFEHRQRMCEIAFADIRRVEVSDVERRLGGRSYTLHTLEALGRELGGASMRLVMGADILEETHRWHRFDRIAQIAPPIVVGRMGYPPPDPEVPVLLPEISSTDVRERIARGAPCHGLVPAAVLRYVEQHGLYR